MTVPRPYLEGWLTGVMFGQVIGYCATGFYTAAVVSLGFGVLLLLFDRRKGWGISDVPD